MTDHERKIQELEDRIEKLVRTQINFQKEISLIRGEIVRLRAQKPAGDGRPASSFYVPTDRTTAAERPPIRPPAAPPGPGKVATPEQNIPPIQPGLPRVTPDDPAVRQPAKPTTDPGYVLPKRTAYQPDPVLSSETVNSSAFSRFISQYTENAQANLEKFVGENLISLIGIVVLILGVGIGAKYAIDNNWISPLARIIIGYVFGFGLVGLAIKFKRKYHNFSAVLVSGGMAIMYFVTFFAYASYGLLSQLPAFGLMVMFTGMTVTAALVYSRQVIAHVGLVGAYAVPFLLSSDSGNYLALFIYIAVVNTGVLAVSVKKRWTPIFYTASLFTWSIFCGWFFTKYLPAEHFYLAVTFLGVLFAILYATKIAQFRLLEANEDPTENLASSSVTAAIFYAMCLAIVTRAGLDTVQYWQFFSYLAVASVAITAASLKLFKLPFGFYASVFFTWSIFAAWFATGYAYAAHFELALVFAGVYFAISYVTTLLQTRVLEDEGNRTANIVASVVTSVTFYSLIFALVLDSAVGAGRYWVLFSYVAAAGILILSTSFKFFRRVFIYVVVPFTWAIYGAWFLERYNASEHFELAAIFASLFFAIFYFSILFHRLVEDNFSLVEHTSLVLSNAFIFYGFGYSLMDGSENLRGYLGIYTAAHGGLHLGVALLVRRLSARAIDVVQVLTVLVLTFASLAIPVQFDGNLVTMIWSIEAAVLFWFGRTRAVSLFEKFSLPVMLLAIGSLGLEWAMAYANRNPVTPFANSDFITAAVFVAAFAFIYITNRDSSREPAIGRELVRPLAILIASVGCVVLFNMFRMEISNYFYAASVDARGQGAASATGYFGDLEHFNILWQINYTLLFLTAMAAVNLKVFRSATAAFVNSVLGVIAIALFASVSMFLLYELRTVFVSGNFSPDFISHWMYIAIRPISYALAAGLLYMLYRYSQDSMLEERVETALLRHGFEALTYTVIFIAASCELINLMGQFGIPDATKLGLSILWGIYALVLVVIGIAKDKKYLRIAAMSLLAVILVKLFFYDIADLETIPKTILFVTLGITLLVVSFLYNKYKDVMFKTEVP